MTMNLTGMCWEMMHFILKMHRIWLKVLESVYHEDPECQQYILNNRNKIENIYSWNNIVEQYTDHFLDIVNKKRVKLSTD
jgi:hypothetical protein